MTVKILIATGSSGGHLLPALTFAETLQKKVSCHIHFLLSRPKSWTLPDSLKSYTVHWSGNFAFPRDLSLNSILFPIKFLINSAHILKILLRERPDLVVGFGGYVSFSSVVMARLLGIPTLIHEQNRTFGKANQILSRFADRVALSFPINGKTESSNSKRVLTGNILRPSLVKKSEKSLYLSPKESDKLNVLLIGGSQGARRLNIIFTEALKGLREDELSQLHIRHITGNLHHSEVLALYEGLSKKLERDVIPFSQNMEDLYLWSHWVIARSGAGTVFELMAFGRPSLLVPYPYASSHQLDNARFLEASGGCEVVEEKDLTPENLRSILRALRKNSEKLNRFSENARKLRILDADERVSELALSLLRSRN